jgi:FlaG/FlaF family flagellin (archaellin)
MKPLKLALPLVIAAALAACGGDGPATGTMSLSLTDAPACGYDNAWVTVTEVHVHQRTGAGENDGGWQKLVLPAPLRVDLLELTNGHRHELGQLELPAGRYEQLRLVLAANDGSSPPANAVKLSSTKEVVALTTPSGQQSGLKFNAQMEVPAGQTADFAIDFDGCKSFVTAGRSGKILLKPRLAVIPILNDAGKRIVGFVDPALVGTGAVVSAQVNGEVKRMTPPDPTGKFTLWQLDAGTSYDVVLTAPGRVNAVMTGVPVTLDAETLIGSSAVRFAPPDSAASFDAFGTITVNGGVADSNGFARALQSFTGGPTFEAGYSAADATTGEYRITLPNGAPVKAVYAPNLTSIAWTADPRAGLYTIEGNAPTFAPQAVPDIDLGTADAEVNFVFPFP